jgi:hypothetical protein
MRSPLSDRLAEAGTTFTERPDGRVAVENLPGLRRTGSATILQDEFADYEAQRKADNGTSSDVPDEPVTS